MNPDIYIYMDTSINVRIMAMAVIPCAVGHWAYFPLLSRFSDLVCPNLASFHQISHGRHSLVVLILGLG